MAEEVSFPTYKGRPLVRCGNIIYYGSMKDKYIIRMEVKSTKMIGENEVADKVIIQLMYTDTTISTRKQIIKSSEKNGLYLAIDIAAQSVASGKYDLGDIIVRQVFYRSACLKISDLSVINAHMFITLSIVFNLSFLSHFVGFSA